MNETITRPLSGLRQGMDRNARRTVNGLRLAAGLARPRTGCTPHLIIWRQDRATMRRYRAGIDGDRPPVLLVPSLINKSHIWDLRPGDSFVEGLLAHGYDVFLIDWGTPDARDAANTTSTYVDGYLPSAYATATEHAGQPPAVLGHCFGGVITTLWAASTASQPPALIALGVPTNWAEMGPLSHITQQGRIDPEDVLDDTGNVPPATLLRAFQMLRPLGDLAGYVTLWDRLDDRRAAQAIWALSDWAHDHVPFPGATFVEMIRQLSRDNGGGIVKLLRLLGAGFSMSLRRSVAFRVNLVFDVLLAFTGLGTAIAAVLIVFTRADTLALNAGHIGLLVGRSARKQTLPSVTAWLDEVRQH